MSRRFLFVFVLAALTVVGGERRVLQTQVSPWPRWDARWMIEIYKISGKEITDVKWLHLHNMEADATSVTLGVNIIDDVQLEPLTNFADIQIKYMVHGQPVSDWLSPPFTFTLQVSSAALPAQDGFHDVSVDVQGARRMDFKPSPIILHLGRGRGASLLVPLLNLDCEYCRYDDVALKQFGPGVIYLDWHTRNFVGYPANPNVTPWHTEPAAGNLYQEEMAPHSDLFGAEPMWWEEPQGTPDAGAKFVRALQPKVVDDTPGNWTYDNFQWRLGNADFGFAGLRNLPYKDGPRSVAWTSPYVGGVVDSTGGLAFADKGGPVRYMKPDGTVITVAGWRLRADRDPVYFLKPFSQIRANMELRGTWTSGQYSVPEDRGFHAPTDVAIDARDEHIWYVTGYDDNAIWKIVVNPATLEGTVSLLAGDVNHAAGFADGVGMSARFSGPISLAFNQVDNQIYVSDNRNDAIRRVNPDTGAVTTVIGRPGQGARVASSNGPNCYPSDLVPGCFVEEAHHWTAKPARSASAFEVPAGSAKADAYSPMGIRSDSAGNLVFMDEGFASIRQYTPSTGAVKRLGDVEGRFDRGGAPGYMGLAVDRWGNSGPKDGIYWFQTVSGGVADGEDPFDRHINELFAWMPPGGGKSKWVSGQDWSPCPDGWGPRECTDVPHYPWMVAVDPRGALYVSGMGEHGITRFRVRRPNDPVPANWIDYQNGKYDWAIGSTGLGPNGHSLAVKFGWEGHNYLGFANLWDAKYQTATDNVLLDDFEIPAEVRNDPVRRARVLNFMRLNAGAGSVSVPAPGPGPGPTPSGDSTPPSVNVVGPSGVARGAKTIDVSASDNVGVVGVQILLDDQALWPEITVAPYRVSWSTTTTPDGPHVITAIARDAAGNITVSAPVSVTVANVRIGFPAPTPGSSAGSSPWLSQSIEPSMSRVTPVRFPIPATAVVQVDMQVYADRNTFVRIVAGRGPMCDEDRRALTTVQVLGPDAGYQFPVVTVPSGLMPCVETLTPGATVRGVANYIVVR